MRELSSGPPARLTHGRDAGIMQRSPWIVASTASLLSLGALAVGAVGVAHAMTVHDAAGRAVSGVEIRGEALDAPTGAQQPKPPADPVDVIAAPSPSAAPSSSAAISAPPPAPAPVAPADSVSVVSAASVE